MKDHDGCVRGFHVSHKAHYAQVCGIIDPEISFGMYALEGGASGEMTMRWRSFSNEPQLVPRLEAYDDSWSALATFGDLLAKMAEVDDANVTPERFIEILLSCGFRDLTMYEAEKC